MNNVNKTLYIPLYGKAYVSKKGLFLHDKKAEQIWEKEGFTLKGRSRSKWLAYYMGIRCAVFDDWVNERLLECADTTVIHIGCGMDSRVLRLNNTANQWYDVDFPEVINERKRYYLETDNYKMISADAGSPEWLESITKNQNAIVVMEGVSMYMSLDEIKSLFSALSEHFENIFLLMDCYTVFSAKMSKYKNPVNDVGVSKLYGIDDPKELMCNDIIFDKEHNMTPQKYIDELHGTEKLIFSKLYAGNFSKKLYKIFEYKKITI